MHNIWLIQRHFPNRAPQIIMALTVCSASALIVGLGLLMLG